MSLETRTASGEAPATDLASFVDTLTYEDLPPEAVRLAERCFVDTVGVTLAGATEGAGAAAAGTLEVTGATDSDRATVVGRGTRATVTDAAFANGTAGHGLDFDDVSEAMSGHPSVTMVPALLAVGEMAGATGPEVLTGFVAGFETQCYLASALAPGHYEAGWHATATLGTFGAATAAASVLDLDATATRHALNVAASMPAGLKRNFGSMTKPMHAGHAARAGVTAALLADEGFTADPAAIGGDRGFLDLYSDGEGPDRSALATSRLGERWALLDSGVHVKKYPCCYFTHTAITAAADLAETHDLKPADVESIDVRASLGASDALVHEDPDTGLEGKFSMHYTVASAIARDRVDLTTFDDENVGDPTVERVCERVSFDVDPTLAYSSHEATVTIDTTDGERVSRTLDAPPGTHDDPLSDAELKAKFSMCAERALDDEAAGEVYRRLNALRDQGDVAVVTDPL